MSGIPFKPICFKGIFTSKNRFVCSTGETLFLIPMREVNDYPMFTTVYINVQGKKIINWVKEE